MPSLGPTEIILIILGLLILFGGRKIPELMRGLGTGMKEFKKATRVDDDDDQRKLDRSAGESYRGEAYTAPRREEASQPHEPNRDDLTQKHQTAG